MPMGMAGGGGMGGRMGMGGGMGGGMGMGKHHCIRHFVLCMQS